MMWRMILVDMQYLKTIVPNRDLVYLLESHSLVRVRSHQG